MHNYTVEMRKPNVLVESLCTTTRGLMRSHSNVTWHVSALVPHEAQLILGSLHSVGGLPSSQSNDPRGAC